MKKNPEESVRRLSSTLVNEGCNRQGEMRGESEQCNSDEPQYELFAPIFAGNRRKQTEAVMDEIAKSHWSQEHEQTYARPRQKHDCV
jgi:hypothetical protein